MGILWMFVFVEYIHPMHLFLLFDEWKDNWTKCALYILAFFYRFSITNILIYKIDLTKNEAGAKSAPQAPKLGYKGGRVPQLSAPGTLASSGANVVCYMLFSQ